jgi:hypothetical protein
MKKEININFPNQCLPLSFLKKRLSHYLFSLFSVMTKAKVTPTKHESENGNPPTKVVAKSKDSKKSQAVKFKKLSSKQKKYILGNMKREIHSETTRAKRGTKNTTRALGIKYKKDMYKLLKVSDMSEAEMVKAAVEIRAGYKNGLKNLANRHKVDLGSPIRKGQDGTDSGMELESAGESMAISDGEKTSDE